MNLFAKQIDSIDSIDLENKLKVTKGVGGGTNENMGSIDTNYRDKTDEQ